MTHYRNRLIDIRTPLALGPRTTSTRSPPFGCKAEAARRAGKVSVLDLATVLGGNGKKKKKGSARVATWQDFIRRGGATRHAIRSAISPSCFPHPIPIPPDTSPISSLQNPPELISSTSHTLKISHPFPSFCYMLRYSKEFPRNTGHGLSSCLPSVQQDHQGCR